MCSGWPAQSPNIQEDSVRLTLPASVAGFNYQIVRFYPDGRQEVIGTYGPGDPRQQSIPVEAGQDYRFGLRSQSTSDSNSFSIAGSFIDVNIPGKFNLAFCISAMNPLWDELSNILIHGFVRGINQKERR